jgi:hypothetical protein
MSKSSLRFNTTPTRRRIAYRHNTVPRWKDLRANHAGVWHMSPVYWGIVFGLVALVATFFVCFNMVNTNVKGSRKVSNDLTDTPIETAEQPPVRSRYAA